MANMIFARRIKALRERNRESQIVLAALVGYKKQAISHWENQGKVPRSHVLKKLAQHYKTTSDYLLGFDAQIQEEENVEVSSDEAVLLKRYRMMGEDQKATIQKVAETFVPL